MMRRFIIIGGFLIAMLGLLSGIRAKADTLEGSHVSGALHFSGGTPNYFDAANGFVPAAGYGNSNGDTNVAITDPEIEFGYSDGSNRDTADFTGESLIVTDLCLQTFVCIGDVPFSMEFADAEFASIAKVSDTFANGGLTYSLVGNTITVHWAGAPASFPQHTFFQAVFDISSGSPTPTPEPSTFLLVAGALLVGLILNRKLLTA
jgi:hypothetical protein